MSQVLISIQSMIFVSDPYYNEPGFEATRNTAAGQENSRRYDEEQQLNTMLYAILPALNQPCPAFADAIRYDCWPAFAGQLHRGAHARASTIAQKFRARNQQHWLQMVMCFLPASPLKARQSVQLVA